MKKLSSPTFLLWVLDFESWHGWKLKWLEGNVSDSVDILQPTFVDY